MNQLFPFSRPLYFLFTLGILAPLQNSAANPLVGYQWKHRLILVSIPATYEGKAIRKQVEKEWKQQRDEIKDRDLVIIDLSLAGKRMGRSLRFSETETKSLRREFSIDPESAVFVLIGKDGTVKARQKNSLRLQKFFALIDTMPMRKKEMRQRS